MTALARQQSIEKVPSSTTHPTWIIERKYYLDYKSCWTFSSSSSMAYDLEKIAILYIGEQKIVCKMRLSWRGFGDLAVLDFFKERCKNENHFSHWEHYFLWKRDLLFSLLPREKQLSCRRELLTTRITFIFLRLMQLRYTQFSSSPEKSKKGVDEIVLKGGEN